MDFLSLAKSRRSVRRYTEKPVSNEQIAKLLEAAQAAPSAGNRQPWHFYVIREEGLKAEIVPIAYGQSFVLSAPLVIVVCADMPLSESRYGDRGRDLYCLQDTAAAIQNMLLCAYSLGLGSCWLGAFDEKALSGALNLEKTMRPVAILTVGYAAGESSMPKRRPVEEIVTFIGDEADVSKKP